MTTGAGGNLLSRIQRVACEERIYRLLMQPDILGPPQSEEEDYTVVVQNLMESYDRVVANSNGSNTPDHALFTAFDKDFNGDDEMIPTDALTKVFSSIHRQLQADLRGLVKDGAHRIMSQEKAAKQQALDEQRREKARLREEAASGESDAQRKAQVKVSAEERYRLEMLIRMGVEDETALRDVTDEFEQGGVEVEVAEKEPEFLRGLVKKQRINYRLTAQEMQARQRGRMNPEAETKNSLEAVAEKQATINKEKRALRARENARLRAQGGIVEPVSIRSDMLKRDLGEAAEEQGIRSAADLPSKLPPWLAESLGSDRSFGKKTDRDISIAEQRRSLPIFKKKEFIMDHIRNQQVAVLVGETGSGKTTQMPQYLSELADEEHLRGIVGCTQPRRVAATSLAERVAEEYGCKVGEEVGFSVRFQEMTSSLTKIKYMTDGMLLREALLDDTFKRYSVIILDEAHERSICTDVLFGICANAVRKREDLKLVVTSATLDTERFCAFFGVPSPLLIEGRTFPVSKFYEEEPVDDFVETALRKVMQIHLEEPPGDILVFFTGQDEIETAAERLFGWTKQLPDIPQLLILPLYATLPNEVQSKVFEPTPPLARKVVLATNVAETSITIDNLFYVIDPGFCKQNVYNPTSGVEQLKIVPISRAQADQRAGRAGRIGEGTCFRLYSEHQYMTEMVQSTVPEIQRSNLGNIVLTLKAVGINDLLEFNFMDPPPKETLVSALEKLHYLGALDEDGMLTPIGRRMSALPLEPSQSKTLLTAVDMGCAATVMTVVSLLSSRNVFYRPRDKQEVADRKKSAFHQPEGDPTTLLAVYDEWLKHNREEDWCRDNFINPRALKDAHETRGQLAENLERRHAVPPDDPQSRDFVKVRKAITAGYFFQVAKKQTSGAYITMADRREVNIHPGSALFHSRPKYVVYHELVMTSKEFMMEVMAIEPSWLLELAPQYYGSPAAGELTKEQKVERLDPISRFGDKSNAWRISKLKIQRK